MDFVLKYWLPHWNQGGVVLVEATGVPIGAYSEALDDAESHHTMEDRDFFGKLIIES